MVESESVLIAVILGGFLVTFLFMGFVLWFFALRSSSDKHARQATFRVATDPETIPSPQLEASGYKFLTVTGTLQSTGMQPISTTTRALIKEERVPSAGDEIPVIFSTKDPTRVNFLWHLLDRMNMSQDDGFGAFERLIMRNTGISQAEVREKLLMDKVGDRANAPGSVEDDDGQDHW